MSEDERRKKLFWMKVVISVLMVVIFVVWAFNFRNLWRSDNNNIAAQNSQQSLDKISAQFNQAISELQTNFNQASSSQAITASSSDFLNNVVEQAKSLSSSTPSSSSTSSLNMPLQPIASGTIATSSGQLFNSKTSGCPQYINCMPNIGGPARSCNIPPGCENITTLVY